MIFLSRIKDRMFHVKRGLLCNMKINETVIKKNYN